MAKKQKDTGTARKGGGPGIKLGVSLFVPLILVLGVIPLIVQMQLVPLPEDVRAFWTQDSAADFFSYYKSRALILAVIYMLCVFGYYKAQGLKDQLLQNKALYVYFGATAVFALFALLSTVLSDYRSIEGVYRLYGFASLFDFGCVGFAVKKIALGCLNLLDGYCSKRKAYAALAVQVKC